MKANVVQFFQGQRVSHPEFGLGKIERVWSENNYSVVFDNGGPIGFALDTNHDVRDLQEVPEL